MLTKDNPILDSIKEIISYQINSKLSELKSTCVKSISGIVKSTEDSTGKVKVQLVGENQELPFINKSGEYISIGDTVIVEYWQSLTKGYIARRNGRAIYNCFVVVNSETEATTNYIPDRLYIVLEDSNA